MSLTLSLDDIVAAGTAFGAGAVSRITDETARAMVKDNLKAKRDSARTNALSVLDAARNAMWTSSRDDAIRDALRTHYWPRMRAMKATISAARAHVAVLEAVVARDVAYEAVRDIKPADDAVRDAMMAMSTAQYFENGETIAQAYLDGLYRLQRLLVLSARVTEATEEFGRIPLSAAWIEMTRTPLIHTTASRRFKFTGGRDRISDNHDDQDILQNGFLHAIESGDCDENRMPFTGSIYRHIQYARATATRDANQEWSGLRLSLLGAKPVENAYPEGDTKHTLRLLGTRNYPTRDQHAVATADIIRENERRAIDVYVTSQARDESLAASRVSHADSFAVVLAGLLNEGHTIQAVSDALGITPQTIMSRALSDADKVRASGIDHEQHEGDAERERDEMIREQREGEALRRRYLLAQRADYIRNRATGTVR